MIWFCQHAWDSAMKMHLHGVFQWEIKICYKCGKLKGSTQEKK